MLALAVMLLSDGPWAASQEHSDNRIVRPEGYIEVLGDGGTATGKGSFSVVPAAKRGKKSSASDETVEEGITWSDDQFPPPQTPQEACQPQADRFYRRLAVLRGNPVDGGEVLDYTVQRAMFGRTALHAQSIDSDQPIPELTWDDELKDLYRAYQKCVKARQR